MLLERVEIVGFRGINRLSLMLEQNNVLIGENAWGKSSLLDALTLLLSPEFDLYHFVRDDFWFPPGDIQGREHHLHIILTFRETEPGRHRVRRFRPLQRCWVPCDDGYHRVFYRLEGELAEDDSVMTLRSFIDGEGEVSFDPQLIAPDEDLTIIVDGAQGRFRTTNWYITLVDRGYLTTRDAVGNCYYGSILHFDLRSDAANDYADGVPEGTFAVRNGQSGVGIWGGDNAACTSFLAEYFSGSPAIGKLTEGNVTIARDGEWYEISFDGLTLAGSDQTSLTGSYEGRVQYIDARE